MTTGLRRQKLGPIFAHLFLSLTLWAPGVGLTSPPAPSPKPFLELRKWQDGQTGRGMD